MRRSFRAATVFAGSAACAVALAPAAGATAKAPDATSGPPHAFTCKPLTVNAVRLYYTASEKHPTPACVSGQGYVALGNGKLKFQSYVGSGYSGYLYIGGKPRMFTVGEEPHNLYGQTVSAIYLQWVG